MESSLDLDEALVMLGPSEKCLLHVDSLFTYVEPLRFTGAVAHAHYQCSSLPNQVSFRVLWMIGIWNFIIGVFKASRSVP